MVVHWSPFGVPTQVVEISTTRVGPSTFASSRQPGACASQLQWISLRVLVVAVAGSPSPLLPAPLPEPGSCTPIPAPTMPAADLRLLVLDGGVVRGMSLLMILCRPMAAVDPDTRPSPATAFDMIGGTSKPTSPEIGMGRRGVGRPEPIVTVGQAAGAAAPRAARGGVS